MKRLQKYLISFIFFIAATSAFKAHAEVPNFDTVNVFNSQQYAGAATEFKNSAVAYFKNLKLLGIEQIQNKKIDSIITFAQNINVLFVDEIKFNNNDLLDTTRNCAYWDKKLQAVLVSYFNWIKLKPEEKQSIAAHEVLGLIGLQDNQFEITALIEAYTIIEKINKKTEANPSLINKIDPNRFDIFKNLIKNPNAFLISGGGGGVSGVGGGGDIRPKQFKALLISQAFLSFNFKEINYAIFIKLITVYQMINIEFSDDIEQGSYLTDAENLTIYVPNNPFTLQNYSRNNRTVLELHLRFVEKLMSGQR